MISFMFSASTSRENLKKIWCWRVPSYPSSSVLACLSREMLLHHTPSLENLHGLLHGLSMLQNFYFSLPAGIFNWMALPLDQIFKIFFPYGFLTHSFIQYLFHLWLLCNWHLLFPLDLWLIITFFSCFISFIWI